MKQIELIFKVFFVTLVVTFLSAQQDCWQAQVSICVLYRVEWTPRSFNFAKISGWPQAFSVWLKLLCEVSRCHHPETEVKLGHSKNGRRYCMWFLGCPQVRLDLIKMLSVLVRTNIPGSQSIYTSRKLDLSRWQIDYLSAFINFTAVFSNYSRLKTVKEYWNAVLLLASTGQKTHVLSTCYSPTAVLPWFFKAKGSMILY